MIKKIQILDCTLRDGGYYNNWFFEEILVGKYLSNIAKSGVDIVEIGFRQVEGGDSGPFAYSSDTFLKTLDIPANLDIAVMIDASSIIRYDASIKSTIANIFSEKKDSKVDIVRIAVNIKEIEECKVIAIELSKLGYRVFLNLMQIDLIASSDIENTAANIQNWGCIEVLYFADSFGSMDAKSINVVVDAIKRHWGGCIGIHAHDNKGHALTNSLGAIDCGVDYIDSCP